MEELGVEVYGASSENEENPQESRRLSLQLYMKSLVHACQCKDANCELPGCQKMKRVICHTKSCRRKANGGCPICKQLIALCCYHAKQCQEVTCVVPFCRQIKHKLSQLQLSQRLAHAQRRRMTATQQITHAATLTIQLLPQSLSESIPGPNDAAGQRGIDYHGALQATVGKEMSPSAQPSQITPMQSSAWQQQQPILPPVDRWSVYPHQDQQQLQQPRLQQVVAPEITSETFKPPQQNLSQSALQQLLTTLRLPTSPQQQKQVLDILKSNPHLMPAVLQQRTRQIQQRQEHQQPLPLYPQQQEEQQHHIEHKTFSQPLTSTGQNRTATPTTAVPSSQQVRSQSPLLGLPAQSSVDGKSTPGIAVSGWSVGSSAATMNTSTHAPLQLRDSGNKECTVVQHPFRRQEGEMRTPPFASGTTLESRPLNSIQPIWDQSLAEETGVLDFLTQMLVRYDLNSYDLSLTNFDIRSETTNSPDIGQNTEGGLHGEDDEREDLDESEFSSSSKEENDEGELHGKGDEREDPGESESSSSSEDEDTNEDMDEEDQSDDSVEYFNEESRLGEHSSSEDEDMDEEDQSDDSVEYPNEESRLREHSDGCPAKSEE